MDKRLSDGSLLNGPCARNEEKELQKCWVQPLLLQNCSLKLLWNTSWSVPSTDGAASLADDVQITANQTQQAGMRKCS